MMSFWYEVCNFKRELLVSFFHNDIETYGHICSGFRPIFPCVPPRVVFSPSNHGYAASSSKNAKSGQKSSNTGQNEPKILH